MLPGTATRGNVHFLRTLRATAEPPPRLIALPARRGPPGSGIALAVLLMVPFWVCVGVLLWVCGL